MARQTNVSIARLTEWRYRALAGAVTALKEREYDRDDEIARLKSKVGGESVASFVSTSCGPKGILSMDKDAPGERAFADVFEAWKRCMQDDAACKRSGHPGSVAYLACRQYYVNQHSR